MYRPHQPLNWHRFSHFSFTMKPGTFKPGRFYCYLTVEGKAWLVVPTKEIMFTVKQENQVLVSRAVRGICCWDARWQTAAHTSQPRSIARIDKATQVQRGRVKPAGLDPPPCPSFPPNPSKEPGAAQVELRGLLDKDWNQPPLLGGVHLVLSHPPSRQCD